MDRQKTKILILEPYYGGSHKYFLEGLLRVVKAEFTQLTLPARKWKMRMQLSAPWFVEMIRALPLHERKFDSVLCSTFVDVAVLRALLGTVEGWNKAVRYLTYFHENQFIYPRQGRRSHHQFTAINFNTALCSDKIAFNSEFNRTSFLNSCTQYVKSATDMKLSWTISDIIEKSEVLYPGIDFTEIDDAPREPGTSVPVIIWNHRWEYDKNPEEFFLALNTLEDEGVDFKLILLGQSFQIWPECFTTALIRFKEKILHSGFAESYSEYVALLKKGDIVVSTSLHEFFGIAVIEALRAGCLPVLPARLSYPELFKENFLYNDGELVKALKNAILKHHRPNPLEVKKLTDRFSWTVLENPYTKWMFEPGNR